MKQSLLHLALLLSVIFAVGCEPAHVEPTPEPGPANLEFDFERITIGHNDITLDISPEDKEMEYVICLSQPRYFEQNAIDTREELLADDRAYFLSLAQAYNISIEEFLREMGWLVKGDKQMYEAINLYPDTEYVVYCYGVDIDGDSFEATTPVNYQVIRTSTPKMMKVSFDVKTKVDYNNVTIQIDPKDYDGYYYSYVVAEGESLYISELDGVTDQKLEHYRNYTYIKFNELINDLGTPVGNFCHKGKVTIEQTLMPYTYYHIAVFAVSEDKMPILCSTPDVTYFNTQGVPESELTIDLKVTDITPYTAQLTIEPSNNSEEYACVFLSRDQVPQFDENETMLTIINNFDPAILTGKFSEQLMPLMPNEEYSVLAFGINSGLPTTKLFRLDFTSASAAEGSISVESIDIVKLFDSTEIAALDPRYSDLAQTCECVAIVEMKTSAPTDKVYFWWYEQWMWDEYSEEAFLEDLLLYDPTPTVQAMDMFYSMDMSDKFLFAGIAEDDEGNLSSIYYSELFTLSKEQCSPAEEFFQYVANPSATTMLVAR
jgi:hypothetical protein